MAYIIIMEDFMKKIMLLSLLSLFIMIIAGCADCTHESDYDYVGITIKEFQTKSGIRIVQEHNPSMNCTQNDTSITNCLSTLTNPNEYGNLYRGFNIQCNGEYNFNLQETIHTLFPQEAYKDDKFESCEDYYVYDFFSNIKRSEIALQINSINIDSKDKNIWYVKIGGTCYQWDVTDTPYAISK